MEDFKVVKNNLHCGFIAYSEFVAQWTDALGKHGMTFSSELKSKLDAVEKEYQTKCREISEEILEKQGWLAK